MNKLCVIPAAIFMMACQCEPTPMQKAVFRGQRTGNLEAYYRNSNGEWKMWDYWCYASKPIKGEDGNWHFTNYFYKHPQEQVIPGDMLVNWNEDKQ